MDFAKIIERAKAICLSPKTEWQKIASESTDVKSLYLNYAIYLAAIPAICGFIGLSLVGISIPMGGTFRLPVGITLASSIVGFGLALLMVFVLAHIVNALAPTFDGKKDFIQALKLSIYASTPAWLAGIFSLIPMLGVLALIAALYGIYLFYLGLPVLMQNPPEKSIGYLALIIVSYIVLAIVINFVTGSITGAATMSAMSGALTMPK